MVSGSINRPRNTNEDLARTNSLSEPDSPCSKEKTIHRSDTQLSESFQTCSTIKQAWP